MKGFRLEARTVTRNEKPMPNLTTQEIDRADRRELLADVWVCGVGAIRQNKPNTIIPRKFLVFSQHTNDSVAQIDSKSRKHPTHLGIQRRERFQDKCVRGLLF